MILTDDWSLFMHFRFINGVVLVELEPESHFSISILAGWGEFSFSVMLLAAALVLLIAGLFSVGELFKLVLVL